MSIRRIPDRYLNTTLHIVRDIETLDEVGDAETVRQIAYGSILANVQPASRLGSREEISYETHGKVIYQTHKAYFNRFQDGVKRIVRAGDYAIDLETMTHYLVLSALEYQASNQGLSDTHHYKLILATTDGEFNPEQSISSKARIAVT